MSEQLTERMEVRLTKEQKSNLQAASKQYERSEGAVIRLGLERLFKSKVELKTKKG